MIEQIEISSLDLRGYRLKSGQAEKAFLVSIIEHGIYDLLQGVDFVSS